jgi:hypothetical protein
MSADVNGFGGIDSDKHIGSPLLPRLSIVLIPVPVISRMAKTPDRIASPFLCTVQAPHRTMPQQENQVFTILTPQ